VKWIPWSSCYKAMLGLGIYVDTARHTPPIQTLLQSKYTTSCQRHSLQDNVPCPLKNCKKWPEEWDKELKLSTWPPNWLDPNLLEDSQGWAGIPEVPLIDSGACLDRTWVWPVEAWTQDLWRPVQGVPSCPLSAGIGSSTPRHLTGQAVMENEWMNVLNYSKWVNYLNSYSTTGEKISGQVRLRKTAKSFDRFFSFLFFFIWFIFLSSVWWSWKSFSHYQVYFSFFAQYALTNATLPHSTTSTHLTYSLNGTSPSTICMTAEHCT